VRNVLRDIDLAAAFQAHYVSAREYFGLIRSSYEQAANWCLSGIRSERSNSGLSKPMYLILSVGIAIRYGANILCLRGMSGGS
jgi:hypothetical protein